MDTRKLSLGLALLAGAYAAPVQFQVSASGGTHATLQAAVDACPATGCTILLTDAEYRFSEPVSVRGKSDIEILGSRVGGKPPVLKIDSSSRDLEDVPSIGQYSPTKIHPILWKEGTPDQVVNSDGTVTIRSLEVALGASAKVSRFLLAQGKDLNGAPDSARPAGWLLTPYSGDFKGGIFMGHLHPALLQIEECRRIKISNIRFDGGTPMEFMIKDLWNEMYSQISGVAAISLNSSLMAEIVDCEFSGWHAAVRSVDANPGGLVSDLMNAEPADVSFYGIRPLADPAAMGGHRIEGNLAHHNHLFVDLEQSWDLASSIRFNRVWENGASRLLTAAGQDAIVDPEWKNMPGGFARMKDVVYPVTIFQGNTLSRNTLDLGIMGYRSSREQLFINNVSIRSGDRDWRELSNELGVNSRNNWIAATHHATPPGQEVGDSVVPFCMNADCQPLTPAWGAAAIDEHLVDKGYFGDDLGAVWKQVWEGGRPSEPIRIQDQTLPFVTRVQDGWSVVLPLVVQAPPSVKGMRIILPKAQRTGVVKDAVGGGGLLNPLVDIQSALPRTALDAGVNLLSFVIPAQAKDSIWKVEFAVAGTDGNTGRSVHSNLGTWLVRPLGKQLLVNADTAEVEPGQDVTFTVEARDSLGNPAGLDSVPTLNAVGWKRPKDGAGLPAAGRKSASSNRFEIVATAPATEGVSQVVFWGVEKGRYQAVSGAAYVKVAARSTRVDPRGSVAPWRLQAISRSANRWNVRISGGTETRLSPVLLLDPVGRRQNVSVRRDGNGSVLEFDIGRAGTHFLKIGERTVPLALVP